MSSRIGYIGSYIILKSDIHMHDICLHVLQGAFLDHNWINFRHTGNDYGNEVEESLDFAKRNVPDSNENFYKLRKYKNIFFMMSFAKVIQYEHDMVTY
ncbi:hypothetical protein CR513_26479, partial [Mucuna pruriens]